MKRFWRKSKPIDIPQGAGFLPETTRILWASNEFFTAGAVWRRKDGHWWRTLLAPGLGAIGLAVSVVLLVTNFRLLVGTDNAIVNGLPFVLAIAALVGVGYGLWLRAKRPERYAGIAVGQIREESVPEPPVAELQLSGAEES